jgi:PhoH-like ATPase
VFELGRDVARGLSLNEYLLLRSDEGKTMPARFYGHGLIRRLKIPEFVRAPGGIPIRARNLEQQFLMDALLDESISLLTCFGKAGTGKTLLSTACALQQICDDTGRYDGLSISRPVIALGKDIGFLPGSLEEKMRPWLQPYYDALEVLIPSKAPKEPQFAAKKVSKKKKKKQDELVATMTSNGSYISGHNGNCNTGTACRRSGPTNVSSGAGWWRSRRSASSAAVRSPGGFSFSTRRSSSRRTR